VLPKTVVQVFYYQTQKALKEKTQEYDACRGARSL
jgi:hypothetical protein